jgi:hypothetical protein
MYNVVIDHLMNEVSVKIADASSFNGAISKIGDLRTPSFAVESELRPRDFIPLVIDVVKLENIAMPMDSCQQRWGVNFLCLSVVMLPCCQKQQLLCHNNLCIPIK